MSRFYEMNVKITGLNKERKEEIEYAAEKEWNFSDWFLFDEPSIEPPQLSAGGQSNLSGGMSEEEFSQVLTEAIWKANKAFCKVQVTATYLEELPYETYELDEDNYQMFCDMGCTQEEEDQS